MVMFSNEVMVRVRIVGFDLISDFVVFKVLLENLIVAAFGDSDALVVGDLVIVIGSLLGLEGMVTMGIVLVLGRVVYVFGDNG